MKNNYEMAELLPLVARLVTKYTSNESTSVTYQVARQLMDCILYHINELIQDDGDKYARIVSSKMSAEKAYQLGEALTKSKVLSGQTLFTQLMSYFNSYKNLAYEETIVKGMPCFFARYDAKFNAQDHILTLDYPLLCPIKNESGIDLIFEYLKRTQIEQKFLQGFVEEKMISFFTSYHKEYKELFLNLCQLVFRQAIKAMIVGKSVEELILDQWDMEYLIWWVKGKTKNDIERELISSLKKLIESRFDNQQEMYHYLEQDIKDFVVELELLKE